MKRSKLVSWWFEHGLNWVIVLGWLVWWSLFLSMFTGCWGE